jgi:hypothetical protein
MPTTSQESGSAKDFGLEFCPESMYMNVCAADVVVWKGRANGIGQNAAINGFWCRVLS